MTEDELLRQACLYAEQDRESFLEAYKRMPSDPVAVEAKKYLKRLRAYRQKRWGKSKIETILDEAKAKDVTDLIRGEDRKFGE